MVRSIVFAVCLTAVASFEFLSIGDWGTSAAKPVGVTMAKYDPEFVLAIGDNFYSSGVKSVNDPQFKSKFEDTFSGNSLQNVPWYVTAGNHDWYGGTTGVSAEIQYTNHSHRWYFPDYYYSKVFTSKDGVTLEVISTDTWKINGGDTFVKFDPVSMKGVLRNKTHLTQALTDGRILQDTHDQIVSTFPEEDPLNPLTVNADTAQLAWLTKTLKASKADWKIVQGHFPIHSCTTGEHGDTRSLIKQMQPILESGKADMYFSGHDHILQHIELNGVHYHGSGAGGQKHSGVNNQYKGLEGVSTGHYGFMRHTGTKTEMTTTFTLADGTKPYTYTLKKGPPTPPPAPSPAPPPPAPTPKRSWECHSKMTTSNTMKLNDHDGNTKETLAQCQADCIKTANCAVIVLHATDQHCHTLSGAVTHAQYTASLKADSERETCMFVGA